MVYQKLKKFFMEKGIKQSHFSLMITENFPDTKISKNKLNNILNGNVVLTAEDFRIIFIVMKKVFPEIKVNDFIEEES